MNNTLIFEGAGWDKCDSCTDIGNCRIRTRIKNNDGEIIYLEMHGRAKSKYGKNEMNWPDFVGFVSHCHIDDNDCSKYRKFELGTRINWQAKYLLEWVNENLNCSFDSLSVINDGSVEVHETESPLCESINSLVFES